MARSSAARSAGPGWRAEQHADDGVREQGPAGQRVRARPGAGRGRGQVEGVEPDPAGAEVQVRAAGPGGEAGVFVFGVDDPALGALVGVAQDFELGQVGLPGAGRGEGDGVVVVACPPVPGDQAGPGGVRAVQDAGQRVGVGGVATGRSGEVNGNAAASAAVSIVRVSFRASVPAGQGGDPALQGPEGGRGGDQQQRAGHRADRRDLLGEVVFGWRRGR